MINQFLRIVNDIKPDIVTMENVPNLAKQEIFRNFVKRLNRSIFTEKKILVILFLLVPYIAPIMEFLNHAIV